MLEALHREHYRHLVRMAVLLVDRVDLAEELVQEAFIRLHRAVDGVEPSARPAYLRSIVMNLARSGLRRRQLARRIDAEHPPRLEAVGRDRSSADRDEREVVVAALRRLPRRQRECLVLRFYEDASVAEIAEALGISEGAVKAHLHRGRQAMAELLKDER